MTDLRRLVRRELDGLHAYAPKPSPEVKLDANESPYPLPSEARRALGDALAALDLNRYPDPRATELRGHLAEKLGADIEEMVVGTGSDEVIAILFAALGEPKPPAPRATVLFPEPTFVMYRHTARVHGVTPIGVALDAHFQLDVAAMRDAIDAYAPNVVFLATPNNPTGNAFDDAAVVEVILHASSSLVVIDEAYAPFAGRSLAHLADTHDNVAIMGTLSKVGLAGARIGYARLPRALAHEVDKARQPYNLSSLAQCVGVLALTELGPVLDAQVARIVAERARVGDAIGQIRGFVALPSSANFHLVRCEGRGADEVGAALHAHGVGVRSFGDSGPLAGHVRITVGSPEQNDRLLDALAAL